MEYEQVKEYLDDIVRDYKNAIRPRYLTNQIQSKVSIEKNILVRKGLEIMADIMGLEIQEKEIEDWRLKYAYTFVYDGVKFVSYEEERMERFKNNL